MTLDTLHFTPFSALGGGVLIGLAASLFVLFNGRIAGISGLLGGHWQGAAMLAGMLLFARLQARQER